jgi:hypothetical protein
LTTRENGGIIITENKERNLKNELVRIVGKISSNW